MELWERIEGRAEATPTRLLAVDEGGRRWSYRDYRDDAVSVAAGLAAVGVSPGSTVAWLMPTWLETLSLMGALARLDCIQVPLLPSYGTSEIGHAVRTTGASAVVVPNAIGDDRPVERVRDAIDPSLTVVAVEDRALPRGSPEDLARWVARDDDPVRWIFHTSGTTAAPKGVCHTDATTFAGGRAWSVPARITSRDRMSLIFPVAHIGGLSLLNIALDVGAGMVVMERFEPDAAVELLARERVTLAGAGPAFFNGYLEVQRRHPDRRVLPDVRVFPSGGAPKSPSLHARLLDEMGVGIASNYGLTECPNVTGTPMDAPAEKVAHTEGVASPGVELSVRDERGRELRAGREGELWVRGPQLFRGYVDPALDHRAFDGSGFFRTGDLVSIDDDGFVTVTGRIKDVIVRKGENISAKEIEDLLLDHPAVSEVAVVGLPDEERGELCCAVVTLEEGYPAFGLEEATRFLAGRGLMVQKLPERLEVIDALPRAQAYGKVLKSELRRRFAPAG